METVSKIALVTTDVSKGPVRSIEPLPLCSAPEPAGLDTEEYHEDGSQLGLEAFDAMDRNPLPEVGRFCGIQELVGWGRSSGEERTARCSTTGSP
jgi:hypothetical protein